MFLANLFLRATTVSREEWKAEKSKGQIPALKPEVEHVVVAFTESPTCSSKEDCIKRVKELQNKHVEEEGEPDIFYNFLIGGDGNVYEGRGWKKAPRPYPKDKKELEPLKNNCIEVAFIGRSDEKPSVKMLKAFGSVLLKAVKEKVLVKDLKQIKPVVVYGNEVLFLREELLAKQMKEMDKNQLVKEYKKL